MKKLLTIFAIIISVICYGQIPTANLVGHWTGGINAADSTITVGTATYKLYNVDFSLSAGYIPLKTKATMKLITAAATDTAFFNRTISPTCAFQNIDLKNRIYFKFASQTLNADSTENLPERLTEIAIYSVKNTGADSVTLKTYFNVPTLPNGKWVDWWYGNDLTGNGSLALPYKTIEKAISVISAGDTIFMKTGLYNEGNELTLNKAVTLYGVGYVEAYSVGTSLQIRSNTGSCYINRMHCIKNNYNVFFSITAGGTTPAVVRFDNCYIYHSSPTVVGYLVYFANTGQLTDVKVYNSVVIMKQMTSATLGATPFQGTDEIIKSYVDFHMNIYDSTFTMKWNKVVYDYSETYLPLNCKGNFVWKYNNISCIGKVLLTTATRTDKRYKAIVRRNTFSLTPHTATLTGTVNMIGFASDSLNVYFDYNTVTYTGGTKRTGTINVINVSKGFAKQMNYNTVLIPTAYTRASTSLAAMVVASTAVATKLNYNTLNGYWAYGLTAGIEVDDAGTMIGGEVIGNWVSCQWGKDNIDAGTHGILITGSVNVLYAYNYVEYVDYGVVYKCAGQSSPNNGVCYNITYQCRNGIYIRAAKDVNIFNNICYSNSAITIPYAVEDQIVINRNTQHTTNYDAENCRVYNNIIYQNGLNTAQFGVYKIDATALSTGTKISNDQYYSDATKLIYETSGGTSYTAAAAVAAGYATSLFNVNPLIDTSTFIPANQTYVNNGIKGTYDNALKVGSNFYAHTYLTTTQGAKWNIGCWSADDYSIQQFNNKLLTKSGKIIITKQ